MKKRRANASNKRGKNMRKNGRKKVKEREDRTERRAYERTS